MAKATSDFSSMGFQQLARAWKALGNNQGGLATLFGCSQAHVSNMIRGQLNATPSTLWIEQLRNAVSREQRGLHIVEDVIEEMVIEAPVDPETPEEMTNRINQVFVDMEKMVQAVARGTLSSLLIDGAPGVGKSHSVFEALHNIGFSRKEEVEEDEEDEEAEKLQYKVFKGTGSAASLYAELWKNRDSVLVVDDCDKMILDEESLNLLKGALDSTARRTIGWHKQAPWLERAGIPKSFDFTGSVIVISNLPLADIAGGTSKIALGVDALVSRSICCPMEMTTRPEIMCRINTIADDVLADVGVRKRKLIVNFLQDNMDKFRSFSLRELVKLKSLSEMNDWQSIAKRGLFSRGIK